MQILGHPRRLGSHRKQFSSLPSGHSQPADSLQTVFGANTRHVFKTVEQLKAALADNRQDFKGCVFYPAVAFKTLKTLKIPTPEGLPKTALRGLSFDKSKLKAANLEGLALDYCDFSRSQLAGANLECTSLRNTIFRWANLAKAQLWAANLKGASLTAANLQHADLQDVQVNAGTTTLGTQVSLDSPGIHEFVQNLDTYQKAGLRWFDQTEKPVAPPDWAL